MQSKELFAKIGFVKLSVIAEIGFCSSMYLKQNCVFEGLCDVEDRICRGQDVEDMRHCGHETLGT